MPELDHVSKDTIYDVISLSFSSANVKIYCVIASRAKQSSLNLHTELFMLLKLLIEDCFVITFLAMTIPVVTYFKKDRPSLYSTLEHTINLFDDFCAYLYGNIIYNIPAYLEHNTALFHHFRAWHSGFLWMRMI